MTHPLYTASVPVFKKMLAALDAILAKTEKHIADKQDRARRVPAGAPVPGHVHVRAPGADRVRFRQERARAARRRRRAVVRRQREARSRTSARASRKTLKFTEGIDAAKFAGTEQREIVLRPGTPRERKFDGGEAYLFAYGIPQFFFHVTTAYALLRHNGVELGKKDFMGEG